MSSSPLPFPTANTHSLEANLGFKDIGSTSTSGLADTSTETLVSTPSPKTTKRPRLATPSHKQISFLPFAPSKKPKPASQFRYTVKPPPIEFASENEQDKKDEIEVEKML